ncbi:FimV/HubP family polar landmark protein [uncultured Rheinheimera sp.]|uniref:FimV/HubP family polar landmark protein n=1 Tax=uncultured Rheinheimera sp. TaxID=400532 RepID=UPI00259268E9|nr:FimV/HubP family polar landmark protein [uncultured Rheinheimera sp.]
MRLVGLLIFSIVLQICSVQATADTTVRLKGPKSTENPDRSRVGPLTPNDTLWRIAEEVRPHPGLNIYQVMYAIYLKNPQSFLDDNFNHLNVGSFLAIPNVDEILQVDAVDAQRKSEEDDRIWADRVRAAAAAKVKQGVNTAQQKDVDKAKQEIKKELIRVEGQQQGQLLDLQKKLDESKVTVEAVLADNTALKDKLDQLADQMLLMKSQVDKDSEIQQQLQLLVAQQAEMLAQQRAQIEREQQGTNFAELWQKISSSSLTWVLLATLPTLFVLFAVLGWIKRRTRKSEQIVTAATAVPQQESGYRSPLPPLDESLDFDESSLMTLDESLLDTGSKGIRLDDEPIDLHDDMLLDTHADEFDDILMNDDDLLDSKDLLDASSMDDQLLDDLLDQPIKAEKDFDPNNILSGADLSALFDEEPELDDTEDVFAQAVAEQLAEEQKQKQTEQTPDELDELIEEIELDEPDNELVAIAATEARDEFSLDEIEEVEEVDFDSLLDELVVTSEAPEVEVIADNGVETKADTAAEDLVDVKPEQSHFDSSELDEFAESLADEELSTPTSLEMGEDGEIDIDALLDGSANWPDAASSVTVSEPELDESGLPEELTPEFDTALSTDTHLEFDEDDYPLSPDDVALLLSDEAKQQDGAEMPAHFHADHADLAELADEVEPEVTAELTETEAKDVWQDLTEQAVDAELIESLPDELELQEDLSVSRVSAASVSVENPSKVLEEYPELEFSDDAISADEAEDELDEDQIHTAEVAAADTAATQQANEDISAELDALEGTDFDALLADYAQVDTQTKLADEQVTDAVLAELNSLEPATPDLSAIPQNTGEQDTADSDVATEVAEQEQLSASKLAQSDDLELSLLALDKLLDDSEDEPQLSQNLVRNRDVGLEDYQDFIAAQHEPELDPTEQGFAADLDLIRAYIEIGEQDGAEHLIDKVLNSAAPEHIKQEAQSLKSQL